MNSIRYKFLEKLRVINWCWAKWGFNFSKFFERKICLFSSFIQNKLNSLKTSIELKCCWPHDVRFYNWGFIFAFIYANYRFSKDLYNILDWTCLWNRVFAFMISFFWLIFLSTSAFNWCFYWNKKKISIK